MDIREGDLVTVHKPVLDANGENEGLYWNPDMDCYDGQTGRVSNVGDGGFAFSIEGFGSPEGDITWEWSFRPSWVVKVADETTNEIMVSSMDVDELFG